MNSLSSNPILHKAAYQFLGKHTESTFIRLIEEGFTEEQKDEILPLINESDPTDALIIKVLHAFRENVICFTEIPNSIFANAYPCTFELEGKSYPNAAACYLDQTRTPPNSPTRAMIHPTRSRSWDGKSEPKFTSSKINAERDTLGKQPRHKKKHCSDKPFHNPRRTSADEQSGPTPHNREGTSRIHNKFKREIPKNELMLKVLRAKFDQHPELKEALLETGHAYIACQHNSERYWSDGFDCTGENQLGICLMQLRGEYRGIGVVPMSACYKIKIEALKERCRSLTPWSHDTLWKIFQQCCLNDDRGGVATLPYLSEGTYTNMMDRIKFEELCPKLSIISLKHLKDRKIVPDTFSYEGGIGKLGLLQAYLRLVDKVVADEGLTYMMMPEGLTRAKQIAIANHFKVPILKDERILYDEHENDAIKETYSLLITNNVFKNTVMKEYNDLYDEVVNRYRCEMPTPQEMLFLCILTKIIFNRRLYPKILGSTEKEIGEDSAFIIGDSPQEDAICITSYSPKWVLRHNQEKRVSEREDTGTGGCLRKYEKYGPY